MSFDHFVYLHYTLDRLLCPCILVLIPLEPVQYYIFFQLCFPDLQPWNFSEFRQLLQVIP